MNLEEARNVYLSYNLPKRIIGYDSFVSHTAIHKKEQWSCNLTVESDYDNISFHVMSTDVTYKRGEGYKEYGNLDVDSIDKITLRKKIRLTANPIISILNETGFTTESKIEDFMLLKKNELHFIRITQEEKEEAIRDKAEKEKSQRLAEYIHIMDDSVNIESSDIRKFWALGKSSNIVMTLGTEEFKETNETIGYIEFIPTMFNDSFRIAFLLCETDKFDDNRKSLNTINRIMRFMLPIYEILRKDFAIETETILNVARGKITGPIIINRITPIDNTAGISKGILQLSDLADELCTEPVDMVVVSFKNDIWDLSFSDGKLLLIDSQGHKEHSLNVIKQELLNHGYFIHEPAFDNYMKKADFSKNLYFRKNRNNPITKPEITKPEITKPEITKPEITKPEKNKLQLEHPLFNT